MGTFAKSGGGFLPFEKGASQMGQGICALPVYFVAAHALYLAVTHTGIWHRHDSYHAHAGCALCLLVDKGTGHQIDY